MSRDIVVIERAKIDLINREYELAKRSTEDAVGHAVECGRMLAAVKADLRHGQWLPWLGDHFDGSSETANLWMRMAANPERVPDFLSVRDAKRQLAKPKPAPPQAAASMVGGLEDDDQPATHSPVSARLDDARDRPQNAGTWSTQHSRARQKILDLLEASTSALDEASTHGYSAATISELLRSAEVQARRAAGQLGELAFVFER